MNTGVRARDIPPDQGCASCGVLWDAEVCRRNHERRCVKPVPPLGVHPVYTSDTLALCSVCLHRLHRFWLDSGEEPTCPQEANALALYRASRR